METPTLNKKQQKSSLSAKKTKTKETIKNVLASPYNNLYWPGILTEDHNILQNVLENNLPKLKITQPNVPWNVLKNVPKAERKQFRMNYATTNCEMINERDRNGLIVGVNDVTKLLEKNLAGAVLITSDVQPKIMVQHIIDQSVLYGVPVIIFKNLRSLLNKVTGIKSTVMGISKDISTESSLSLVKDTIEQIYKKCPAPVDHINYNRSVNNEVVMEAKTEMDVLEPVLKINEADLKNKYYLKRESKDKRVFVPEYKEKNVKSYTMEVDESGFLPFSIDPTPTTEKIVVPKYKSLIVKRLKGDPNRNKRKIQSLKNK